MMTALGATALPPGWLRGQGGRFRFRAPECAVEPDSEEDGGDGEHDRVVVRAAEQSHEAPPEPEERGSRRRPTSTPDDELGVNSPDGEKVPRMVIDLPPLIDFTAEDDDWVPPKAIMAPPAATAPVWGYAPLPPLLPLPAAAAGTGGFDPRPRRGR